MNILNRINKIENITNNEEILINYINKYPEEFINLKPK